VCTGLTLTQLEPRRPDACAEPIALTTTPSCPRRAPRGRAARPTRGRSSPRRGCGAPARCARARRAASRAARRAGCARRHAAHRRTRDAAPSRARDRRRTATWSLGTVSAHRLRRATGVSPSRITSCTGSPARRRPRGAPWGRAHRACGGGAFARVVVSPPVLASRCVCRGHVWWAASIAAAPFGSCRHGRCGAVR